MCFGFLGFAYVTMLIRSMCDTFKVLKYHLLHLFSRFQSEYMYVFVSLKFSNYIIIFKFKIQQTKQLEKLLPDWERVRQTTQNFQLNFEFYFLFVFFKKKKGKNKLLFSFRVHFWAHKNNWQNIVLILTQSS